jgi:hypothetical protein
LDESTVTVSSALFVTARSAVPSKYAQLIEEYVAHDQIRSTVGVEIACRNSVRIRRPQPDVRLNVESALSVAEHDCHVVARHVGRGEVEDPVVVEVGDRRVARGSARPQSQVRPEQLNGQGWRGKQEC